MREWTEAAFVAGDPVLDFLNTVSDKGKTRAEERIATWPDFLGWARASTLFDHAEAATLEAVSHRSDADALLVDARRLRETAHEILGAMATGREPPGSALSELELRIKTAINRADLRPCGSKSLWQAGEAPGTWLADFLALRVEEFLHKAETQRLRECDRCTWLFIDRGRGKGRRWCDMRTCGNRAKVEAFRKS